jgi:hypothetical protein
MSACHRQPAVVVTYDCEPARDGLSAGVTLDAWTE